MKVWIKSLGVFVLLAVVALLTLPFWAPDCTISKDECKRRIAVPSSHYFHWRDAEIHYADEGQGIPVLMIHGLGGNFHNFDSLNEVLKSHYRCIRIDVPGFGLSDFPTLKNGERYLAAYSEFYQLLFDSLHIDSAYVIGNSMGGAMAWTLAAKQPQRVKKLVLLAAAGYDIEAVKKNLFVLKFGAMKRLAEKGMPMFMSKRNAELVFFDDSKIRDRFVAINNASSNKKGNMSFLFKLVEQADFPDSAWIKTIQCPTFIVWGKEDKVVPADHANRFKRDIANSQVLMFEGCGHVPMIERPGETAVAIARFLGEEPI
ncbi:MAG: alpha/beta hydrolase [Chitinophagales bacterium]